MLLMFSTGFGGDVNYTRAFLLSKPEMLCATSPGVTWNPIPQDHYDLLRGMAILADASAAAPVGA